MTILELARISEINGLSLSEEQLRLLEQYAALLKEWNAKVNLISRKDEEHILTSHILHSLSLLLVQTPVPLGNGWDVFDLGSGGGLPGIPIKIARSDLKLTLCDSIAKKMRAVSDMIEQLHLSGIAALTSRAEDLAKQQEHKQCYDAVVSRAVAPLDELIMWSRELRKPGAPLLTLKGGDLTAEIAKAKHLREVKYIIAQPIELKGFGGFVKEEKQIVTVIFAE